jgi:hypothetical protein
MYTQKNYGSFKELHDDFNAGKRIGVYYPGIPGPDSGTGTLEGPHYPKPHKWYASIEFCDLVITKLNGKLPKLPK